jgi:hypothetical protein
MGWLIRWDGAEFASDDMTIEDLGEIERATGEPWSTANPLRTVKVARAFLVTALLRSGRSEQEVADTLTHATLKDLKGAFDYRPDDNTEAPPEGRAPLDHRPKTSRGSSPGGPRKAGRPARPAGRGSEMSSPS